MSWSYDGHDPGIGLFSACLAAGAPMVFESGMRILEIGCCEADWLHEAHAAWPYIHFVGFDTRAPDVTDGDGNVKRLRWDAMDESMLFQFADGQKVVEAVGFDAIVSLSAIEHIGLGHYGDPLDPDGDTKALANCWRWLKPGGWIYFDVPYDPTGYRVEGTECRVYDDGERFMRLWVNSLAQATAKAQWLWEGYSEARNAMTLVPKPTVAVEPFHYAAMIWRKVG